MVQKEALHYEKAGESRVRCLLCPKECLIEGGRSGFCRVRNNDGGRLVAAGYARCSSFAVDPIEKKPLYHFYPGAYVVSVGTVGCNLNCRFCQNWEIAHRDAATQEIEPEDLIEAALGERAREPKVIGIAYTYSEPVVWYEYVMDTASLAKTRGLKNVLVTNGSIQTRPLREMLPLVDALNVDVKAFTDEYYIEICSGLLKPVLNTVEEARQAGRHVEVTTLVVPGLNDSEDEVRDLAKWLSSVDRGIPLHFSRYFPNYRMRLPPTPEATLRRCRDVAREYLHHVYTGNVRGAEGEDTYCPACGETLLERSGMSLSSVNLRDGACPRCGRRLEIQGDCFATGSGHT